MKKTNKRGFTLIELMIVVAIIGILAAVAIPAFINYMKRAKTSEATLNLKSIAEGAVSYHDTHGNTLPTAATAIPSSCAPSGTARPLTAEIDNAFAADEGWNQIGWKPHKEYLYCYAFAEGAQYTGNAAGIAATATATGDLDDDDTNSTFTRNVERLSSGLVKPTDLEVTAELE